MRFLLLLNLICVSFCSVFAMKVVIENKIPNTNMTCYSNSSLFGTSDKEVSTLFSNWEINLSEIKNYRDIGDEKLQIGLGKEKFYIHIGDATENQSVPAPVISLEEKGRFFAESAFDGLRISCNDFYVTQEFDRRRDAYIVKIAPKKINEYPPLRNWFDNYRALLKAKKK